MSKQEVMLGLPTKDSFSKLEKMGFTNNTNIVEENRCEVYEKRVNEKLKIKMCYFYKIKIEADGKKALVFRESDLSICQEREYSKIPTLTHKDLRDLILLLGGIVKCQ